MHETLPLLKSTAFPAVQRGRQETIKRLGSMLVSKEQFDDHMRLLHEGHDAANLNLPGSRCGGAFKGRLQ